MIVYNCIEKDEYREKNEYVYVKDVRIILRKLINNKNIEWKFVSILNDKFRALFLLSSLLWY